MERPFSCSGSIFALLGRGFLLAAAASLLIPAPGMAKVLRVEIERQVPILGGEGFGQRGEYELLEGRVYFGTDPASEANTRVSDLELAPRGDDGLVHAWSELVVLQPRDPAKRRGTALVEVVNRGRRIALGSFNRVPFDFARSATLDPERAQDFGDGFLMDSIRN